MSTKLSLAALDSLPAIVGRPAYHRSDLSPGILHFGVGNFHRAHQAVYLDALFSSGRSCDWALVGAGVRPADSEMHKMLGAQDWLTTIVERDANTERAHVTGAMIDFIDPADGPALLGRLADPAIRIVSLTITEGGYFLNSADGKFDIDHPEIVADSAHPDQPRTVFGMIVAALKTRRLTGTKPFTIMSCDNIPGNGHVAKMVVTGLAAMSDPELAEWVAANVSFPNSMVDRITPATTDRERELVASKYGIDDNWPVASETFLQWVIEDDFPAGRPRLEDVGVTFVDDVEPFELMKIRILNGGHAAIAYPAGLLDIHFVHDAMQEPLIAGFLRKLEMSEIIPIVPPVPNVDLAVYFAKIVERFANPTVGDTIRRLCLDGSNRQPKFILPSVNDRLAKSAAIDGLALASAFWCRYCAGTTESGAIIAPNDANWSRLNERATAAKNDPRVFLEMRDIFGNLAEHPSYVQSFSRALTMIWSHGTRQTLQAYLDFGL